MIQIYSLSQAQEWDTIVKGFENHDVYYLSGYVKAFYIHGDGDPFLLYYQSSSLEAIYVYMRRHTAVDGVYDSITPYGYGGVLFEGEITEENKLTFWKEYLSVMEKEQIIDGFVRFHPVLKNANEMRSISKVVDLGKTVAIDLSSPEVIWENIISKNRNMIRKAEKNGIEIKHGKNFQLFKKFKEIYNATMRRDSALDYYFFEDEFYESIHRDLFDNYEMFYAELNGKIIAMSIILFANNQVHYHLSGSLSEYRNLAPTNLLLYKVALWGCVQKYKTLHLGGGLGSEEDNLYKFKAAFNKKSDCQYSIGKQIYNESLYNLLVEYRKKEDVSFDVTSSFFPLYRLITAK